MPRKYLIPGMLENEAHTFAKLQAPLKNLGMRSKLEYIVCMRQIHAAIVAIIIMLQFEEEKNDKLLWTDF
jgi:deoxycytidylate deaminase